MQAIQQGPGSRVANLSTVIGWSPANLFLDSIKCRDAFKRLPGDRRCMRFIQVMELAPHMGSTGRFNDRVFLVQTVESGESIRLQRALEVCQVLGRMLTLAIG